jgi:pyruvate formate lyase activating enzyme
VKLDTNGTRPDVLRRVLEEGLADLVAMDIKNSPQKYALTTGVENIRMDRVNESVSLLMGGNTPFEFRTTVVDGLHMPEDFAAIGEWLAGDEPYFLQNFKDSGDLIDPSMRGKTPEQMAECLTAVLPYLPKAEIRGL